jgi:hypothetical protein
LQDFSRFVVETAVPILELHDALSAHHISVSQRRLPTSFSTLPVQCG